MNIDVVFIAGTALILLGWFVRKKAKGHVVRQIMAVAMVFGIFVILSHTLLPFAMAMVVMPISIGPDAAAGVILGVAGLIMLTQARRGSMATFAPIFTSIGVFVVLLDLAMPYIASITDWSTTL